MTVPLAVSVTLSGPFFTKKINSVVRNAIVTETMKKIEKRLRRKGRKLGRKRNPIGPGELTLGNDVTLVMTSTTNWPRTKGTAWKNKNVAIIKAMAPRVLRKTAKRIAGELS